MPSSSKAIQGLGKYVKLETLSSKEITGLAVHKLRYIMKYFFTEWNIVG